jgi:hypothetical protein
LGRKEIDGKNRGLNWKIKERKRRRREEKSIVYV